MSDNNMHPLTLEQAKELYVGQEVYSRFTTYKNGQPRRVKVNGQVKTWKRNPNRVKVPYKIGLWEYGYITEENLADFSLTNGDDND